MTTTTETKASQPAFLGSEGVYMLPHHVSEIERLRKQHHFMATTTDGLLLDPRVTAGDGPLRVLDAGCADGWSPFPLHPTGEQNKLLHCIIFPR